MFRKSFSIFSILLVITFVFVSFGSVFADNTDELFPGAPPPSAETGEMNDETPALWFVELSNAPTAAGGRPSTIANQQRTFRNEAQRAGLAYEERYAFSTLWNGFSIQASPSQVSKFARLSGVKAIYPVEIISIPETTGISPEMATALAMTGADVAQNDLGYTGAGIKVAIMDTGIDYHHPDLGGCFGPGCRVAFGYDFVGDDFNADPSSAFYNPVPAPNPDPDDCHGHGTHVAGIVGANGGVVGVAPNVTFGAYRVFGCGGSTTADIMLAAMERSLADGMDVLNMSIGSAFQWPQYPTAVAASLLVDEGMVVVASIGNSGASGLYSAGAPGLGDKVIGVASFDNTHTSLAAFTISPDDTLIGYGTAAAAPLPPTSGTYPMARTGTTTTPDDACAPIAEDLTGYVVLIRRGACPFHTKALNAQDAGAAGVVLYNNAAGRFSPTVAGTPAITIPVVAISDAEGALIDSRLADGPVDMTWTEETLDALNPTGGLISSFSSYGLSPDLALKPDIGAPGGLIRSTYPLESGAYATVSGTSMSSPHVAGAAALLLEARPGTPAESVRDILQNSAKPKNWWGNPGLGFLDNVHRQGAGMLDIVEAILSTSTITPAKIAAGESEAGPFTQTLTIENSSAVDVTYDLSFVNALSTGGVTAPGFFLSNASVTFSESSVTVPAGGAAAVQATINAATGPVNGQYGGYIVFTPQGGGQVYRVPFAGFVGDYQGIEVLTDGGFGFPLVGRATSCIRVIDGACIGGSYTLPPADYVYDMTSVFEQPSFLVHFDHQARLLQMGVYHADSGSPVHPVFYNFVELEYLPRNSTSTGFFAFHWDGTRIHSNMANGKGNTNILYKEVPDGDYVIVVKVLKALGDPSNPGHWETWTSPVITIDRP
jgi:minor extracellular serine protease Vpr